MPLTRANNVGVALEGIDVPTGTTAQREASPATGVLRFNTTDTAFEGYNGGNWTSVGGGATGGGSDAVFYLNDQTVTTDFTIAANQNAACAGEITIANGITVTISGELSVV